VASLSFEGIGSKPFESEELFCASFSEVPADALEFSSMPKEGLQQWGKLCPHSFKELSASAAALCKGRKVVLFIDEVDMSFQA
ncbi:AAA family ATPase, partial [Lachnospiraceae bacterium ZAX-1]